MQKLRIASLADLPSQTFKITFQAVLKRSLDWLGETRYVFISGQTVAIAKTVMGARCFNYPAFLSSDPEHLTPDP